MKSLSDGTCPFLVHEALRLRIQTPQNAAPAAPPAPFSPRPPGKQETEAREPGKKTRNTPLNALRDQPVRRARAQGSPDRS